MKYLILIKDEGRTLRIEGEVETTGNVLKEVAKWLDKGDLLKELGQAKPKSFEEMTFEEYLEKWLKQKGGYYGKWF